MDPALELQTWRNDRLNRLLKEETNPVVREQAIAILSRRAHQQQMRDYTSGVICYKSLNPKNNKSPCDCHKDCKGKYAGYRPFL